MGPDSNLLERHEKPTLGALLGLLLGAVIGLYPFQQSVPPEPGFTHRGLEVPADELGDVPPEDWPLARYTPSGGELASAGAAFAGGLALTLLIARLGRDPDED